MRSNVLHMQLVKAIGRHLFRFVLSLPGSGIGIIVASFQDFGTLPVLQSTVNQAFLAFFDFVAVFGTVPSAILIRRDAKDSIGSSAFRTVSSRSRAAQRLKLGPVSYI